MVVSGEVACEFYYTETITNKKKTTLLLDLFNTEMPL